MHLLASGLCLNPEHPDNGDDDNRDLSGSEDGLSGGLSGSDEDLTPDLATPPDRDGVADDPDVGMSQEPDIEAEIHSNGTPAPPPAIPYEQSDDDVVAHLEMVKSNTR